jgi:hypothetical protein
VRDANCDLVDPVGRQITDHGQTGSGLVAGERRFVPESRDVEKNAVSCPLTLRSPCAPFVPGLGGREPFLPWYRYKPGRLVPVQTGNLLRRPAPAEFGFGAGGWRIYWGHVTRRRHLVLLMTLSVCVRVAAWAQTLDVDRIMADFKARANASVGGSSAVDH